MPSAAASRFVARLALLLRLRPCLAQHAVYRFATQRSNFESLTSFLRWVHVEPGDVYAATKFFTGCSVGRFGGQFHADGSQIAIFSMWDSDGVVGSARGLSPRCTRFDQGFGAWPRGTGARCILPLSFDVGSEYRLELTKAANASGTAWSLAVSQGAGASQLVGSIFVRQQQGGSLCSLLEPEAESSQEHYAGGRFRSSAAWRGPFLDGEGGVAPVDADVDCGPDAGGAWEPSMSASAAVPGGSAGPPNVFFDRGTGVVHGLHGCERGSLWQHGDLEARGGDGFAAAGWPLFCGVGAVAAVAAACAVLATVACRKQEVHSNAGLPQGHVLQTGDKALAIEDGMVDLALLEDGFVSGSETETEAGAQARR